MNIENMERCLANVGINIRFENVTEIRMRLCTPKPNGANPTVLRTSVRTRQIAPQRNNRIPVKSTIKWHMPSSAFPNKIFIINAIVTWARPLPSATQTIPQPISPEPPRQPTRQTIPSLPTTRPPVSFTSTETSCIVCLEDYQSIQSLVVLPCKHELCAPCFNIIQNSSLEKKCPLCRSPFQ